MEYQDKPIIKLHDLGHSLARSQARRGHAYLTIISPSSIDDGAYSPPTELSLYGQDELTKIRDIITEILDKAYEHEPKSNGN